MIIAHRMLHPQSKQRQPYHPTCSMSTSGCRSCSGDSLPSTATIMLAAVFRLQFWLMCCKMEGRWGECRLTVYGSNQKLEGVLASFHALHARPSHSHPCCSSQLYRCQP